MRRTPDFFRDDDPISNVVRRPDSLVGDYLENRRILKILHSKFHFPELEGIINDAEALNAFYMFDGTRFIKARVVSLFDSSEYSFSNMLAYLGDAALRNFNFPVDDPSHHGMLKLRRDFLLNYEESFEFDYFSELVAFVDMEGSLSREEDLSLLSYHSDIVSSSWSTLLATSLEGVSSVFDAWNSYMESDYMYPTSKKRFWQYSRERNLLMQKILHIKEKMKPFSNLSMEFYIDPYMTKLSACLNLPDDKHAEPEEKVLVDNWLELFDKFYPQYEKLKAWYIQEKKNTSDVEVRI